jgi:hypothetical protein
MKRVSILLLLLVAISLDCLAADKSAKKIIERYKKAVGASAARRIKSTLIVGSIKTADGATGRYSYQSATPESLRVDIEAGELRVSECYNGKSAWRMEGGRLRTLLGEEAKRLRLEALIAATRLADISRNRIVAQSPIAATVEGKGATGVELIKDDARVKLFFDDASGLIVKRERETPDGLEEIFYGDYRKIDGVMEPHSMRIKRGSSEMSVTADRIEHNRGVDVAAFRYPRIEGAKPLPDVEALLKTVVANQEKIEQMRERYTCRMTETERKLDGGGRVKQTEIKTYEVTPVGNRTVERLMSVNGKELSAAEREKEDRRVQKQVEEIIKRREKELQKKERDRARGGEQEEEDDDRVTILDFLHLCEITSVRREVFRGVEVIAFDFEPRKSVKPKNRVESIVSKLAGTLWVDEQAGQIVRLEARLTDSFKMAGGLLASVGPSTAFAFEQEKVDGEVWLPSLTEGNISVRLMLFSKINRSMKRSYSDYKKHRVDSTYETGKPAGTIKPDNFR